MSDYVEGEDNWKKVNHTNLSDAQADIAALQARIDELVEAAREVHRISDRDHEAWHKLAALLEGSKHGIDTGE